MLEYTFKFKPKFAEEFHRYPEDQQDAILGFLSIYSSHGLKDFSKYKGKISPSWKKISPHSAVYRYTRSNSLWHAHIGLPKYYKSLHNQYYTSDMILHFQWIKKGDVIDIVDITDHYKADGTFWLPSLVYLRESL